MSLSAVMIVKNEEANLEACLQTVSFAEEIIVVDSGSVDRTVEIAKRYTDKVYTRTFDNFSAQKNFAISKASAEWILSIDADERVTLSLRDEILGIIQKTSSFSAYRIKRSTFFLGKQLRYGASLGDRPVRLFKTGSGEFRQPIHEFFESCGEPGELSGPLLHYTTPTIAAEIAKTSFYTELEVLLIREQRRRIFFWDLVLRPLAVFFSTYIIQRGFLDGITGLIYSFFSARYAWVKYRKVFGLCRTTKN